MRNFIFQTLRLISLLIFASCSEELDYPEQAREFYAQQAQSPDMARLLRHGIRLRDRTLYLQECERTPDDSLKTWAIYENYPLDDTSAPFDLADLKIAFTPFDDPRGGRIIPVYETIADTIGSTGQAALQIREIIRAFNRLGMREVICGGQGVVYLVQPSFMLIHIADAAQTPEAIKNVATKLDENWYFEISFERQDAERRKLSTALREFWENVQKQKAQQQQTETKK